MTSRSLLARALLLASALTVLGLGIDSRRAALATSHIGLEPIATGLSQPLAIVDAYDGSGRLFIVEQTGAIKVRQANGTISTFLDLTSKISCCEGEQGLLDIAFDPAYESNGYFYVNYTDAAGSTVIERYTVSGNPDVGDPGSDELVLTFEQPGANHNGGDLVFGPDGYLYIGSGDGGGLEGDPDNNAQNLNVMLGKVLRIDVSAGLPYAIPPDNPLVGSPGLDEIVAYGLRNPWRLSFDSVTGDLYLSDVGQSAREELNVVTAGDTTLYNYGWHVMEGTLCYDPPSGCDPTGLRLPDLEYSHADGNCSITGGYVHRGSIASLYGAYVFGDFCSGKIWQASDGGSGWTMTELLDLDGLISTFGEDASRALYVADYLNGTVYRIVEDVFVDTDGDGVADSDDNCPATPNPTQDDGDADLLGDVCEAAHGAHPGTPDTDGDGCLDGREVLTAQFAPNVGGDRDAASFWDFFDVPTPVLLPSDTAGSRNGSVSLADVLAVLVYSGTTAGNPANSNGADYDTDLNMNGIPDGREYDRMPSADGSKPWRSSAPNGSVTLQDALVALAQAGHNCT